MNDVSESWGIPMTLDSMFVMITSDDLKAMKQRIIKQLKNRFGSIDYYNCFAVGVDTDKMMWYDVDNTQTQKAQAQMSDVINNGGESTGTTDFSGWTM